MDKIEYRAVIKFLVLEGNTAKQVEERLTAVYKESSPSAATIKRWVKEFQRGRESLEDDPRPGRQEGYGDHFLGQQRGYSR